MARAADLTAKIAAVCPSHALKAVASLIRKRDARAEGLVEKALGKDSMDLSPLTEALLATPSPKVVAKIHKLAKAEGPMQDNAAEVLRAIETSDE